MEKDKQRESQKHGCVYQRGVELGTVHEELLSTLSAYYHAPSASLEEVIAHKDGCQLSDFRCYGTVSVGITWESKTAEILAGTIKGKELFCFVLQVGKWDG